MWLSFHLDQSLQHWTTSVLPVLGEQSQNSFIPPSPLWVREWMHSDGGSFWVCLPWDWLEFNNEFSVHRLSLVNVLWGILNCVMVWWSCRGLCSHVCCAFKHGCFLCMMGLNDLITRWLALGCVAGPSEWRWYQNSWDSWPSMSG